MMLAGTVNNKITPPPNLPGRKPLWLRTQRECLQAWNKELSVSGSITTNGHTSAKKKKKKRVSSSSQRNLELLLLPLLQRKYLPKTNFHGFYLPLFPSFLERKIDIKSITLEQTNQQSNKQNLKPPQNRFCAVDFGQLCPLFISPSFFSTLIKRKVKHRKLSKNSRCFQQSFCETIVFQEVL